VNVLGAAVVTVPFVAAVVYVGTGAFDIDDDIDVLGAVVGATELDAEPVVEAGAELLAGAEELAGAEVAGALLLGRVIVTPALAQKDCANCSVFWMSEALQAVEMQAWVLVRKAEALQMHFASVTAQPVAVMPLRAQVVAHEGSWLRS